MTISPKKETIDIFVRVRTGGSLIRNQIALGTPSMLQPFLTWLTACPIDGETHKECHSTDCVKYSCIKVFASFLVYMSSCNVTGIASYIIYTVSIIILTSAFGLLQVGVFHYCSHGTVFKSWKANINTGRIVSAVCLLPSFDYYRTKHMRHHSHEVLLTDNDEFTEFVIKQCGLKPGLSKKVLWSKVIMAIISPTFHCKFMLMRILLATDYAKTRRGIMVITGWFVMISLFLRMGHLANLVAFFLIPLSVPFQITVVLRTLCEHHVPDIEMNVTRDRSLSDHATRPVFAGCKPPPAHLKGFGKVVSWAFWWFKMMTFHLLFRVIVLVGDAARHDLHHARPGNRNWANYMCDRYPPSRPAEFFCSNESWGCFSTIEKCICSISSAKSGSDTRLFNN